MQIMVLGVIAQNAQDGKNEIMKEKEWRYAALALLFSDGDDVADAQLRQRLYRTVSLGLGAYIIVSQILQTRIKHFESSIEQRHRTRLDSRGSKALGQITNSYPQSVD